MASPTGHSYPSPEEAQMNEGTAYPYPIAPQQQQPQQAPQAIMNPGHQHHQHQQSRHSSQAPEAYMPREIAPHPAPFGSHPGNPEFGIPQMHQPSLQPTQPMNPFDPSGSPVSKKTKAGRACDQCRTKKTRCDEARNSDGDQQCTSCRRNNQKCQFSREPQKRGPSKGYIKELAERVGAIESRDRAAHIPSAPYPTMGSAQSHIGAGPFMMDAGQPATGGQPAHGLPLSYPGIPIHSNPRKRTHSMSEEPDTSSLQAQLHASAHLQPAGATNMSMQQPNPTPVLHPGEEGDKVAIIEYYTRIHPFLPFLPHNWDRMNAILANVSPKVRRAFYASLQVFAYPGKHNAIPSELSADGKNQTSSTAFAYLVRDLQNGQTATQNLPEKLVILQSVLLTIFAMECNSPAHAGNRGWYVQALGAALFAFPDLLAVRKNGVDLSGDQDAFPLLARRAVLTLVTMERWNAAGSSTHTMIVDKYTKLVVADKLLLGHVGYATLRASYVLGHIIDAVLNNQSDPMLWQSLRAEKDRVVEGLEIDLPGLPNLTVFLDLFFDHHAASFIADITPPEHTAIKLFAVLSNQIGGLGFFLNHHIAALSVMVLDDAIRKHDLGEEAPSALTSFCNALAHGGINIPAGPMWADALGRSAAASRSAYSGKFADKSAGKSNGDDGTTDRAGLQHLADAAVGETEAGLVADEYKIIAPVGYLIHVANA